LILKTRGPTGIKFRTENGQFVCDLNSSFIFHFMHFISIPYCHTLYVDVKKGFRILIFKYWGPQGSNFRPKIVNLSFWPKLLFHATFQAFYFHYMVLSYIVCRFAIWFYSYNFQKVETHRGQISDKKMIIVKVLQYFQQQGSATIAVISDCLHQVIFLCLNHFQFIHTFMCSSVAIFSMVKSIYSAIYYICKFYHLKTDVKNSSFFCTNVKASL
jgi:hypothetical protein